MSELRFNRITGDWLIIATERSPRPEEFITEQDPSDPPCQSRRLSFLSRQRRQLRSPVPDGPGRILGRSAGSQQISGSVAVRNQAKEWQ